MHFGSVLANVLSRVPGASIAREQEQSPTNTLLNITALSSRGGYSVIECWQLETEAVSARSALNWIVSANTTQAELSIIQPRTSVGEAWAPAVQYVFCPPYMCPWHFMFVKGVRLFSSKDTLLMRVLCLG